MTARGAMEKDWCVRVIEGEEVRGDDLVKYFLPRRGRNYLLSPKWGDGS